MTTSDLWRSWPHRPTSRTVHLLNHQHLRAASLWHSNISLTQALHIITLATTPSRLLSLSIVTTILDMGPSHSIVLDKMFLGVDMQIRCRHENPLCITTSPMSRRHIHHGIPTPTHVLSLDLASVNHAGVT